MKVKRWTLATGEVSVCMRLLAPHFLPKLTLLLFNPLRSHAGGTCLFTPLSRLSNLHPFPSHPYSPSFSHFNICERCEGESVLEPRIWRGQTSSNSANYWICTLPWDPTAATVLTVKRAFPVSSHDSWTEVEGILELGNFSFVVQLICRQTMTSHDEKQFKTQGIPLPQAMVMKPIM